MFLTYKTQHNNFSLKSASKGVQVYHVPNCQCFDTLVTLLSHTVCWLIFTGVCITSWVRTQKPRDQCYIYLTSDLYNKSIYKLN